MPAESLSLSQLNHRIKNAVNSFFTESVWVIAEISELRLNSNGHCYLELIEKSTETEQILARSKATIWAYTFRILSPYFETTTGYRLSAGLKVLLRVLPEFHEVYGMNLVIKDIDPTYTLGDLARRKLEIIKKLKAEGVIDMNRQLIMPLVPWRIAVISSETAAGYGDFMHTLLKNHRKYRFNAVLFPAQVQGEKAAESIINALDRIYEREHEFDVVVLIRGGGAQSDLDCFNSYDLVYHITQFPLPVISGIGHERDETITDLVTHTSVKTPTAAAEFLIDCLINFENILDTYTVEISTLAGDIIREEESRILNLSRDSVYLIQQRLNNEKSNLGSALKNLSLISLQYFLRKTDSLSGMNHRLRINYNSMLKSEILRHENSVIRLTRDLRIILKQQTEYIAAKEKNLEYLKPEKVLKRGYSITTSGGRLIKNSGDLKEGDELITLFNEGSSLSIVKKTK